ncbi:MAG: protein-(glutamine-N5) methyltransferase, release factor-specific [Rhodocyclales bacterium RIFCSPLOWO2_02_FULL_63_24]|nr:MAG: protein-(glutamine-N5) methyltransferase, release factor-specific [Rhodocyclales bacterium RIFCSPLOWO2_02_FULL_63_24]
MSTVAAALAAARTKLPASEARLLLGHVLGRPAAWLLTHDDEVLDEAALLAFASRVARRAGGEPVAYLLGYREFFGREFAVSRAVLIPRPETELLIEIALARVMRSGIHADGAGNAATSAARILDLGTGSGCIAITLALEIPQAQVTAVDASAAALEVAQDNAERLGAKLRLLQSHWFDRLADERFDLIVTNPPYIADADPHLLAGDLRHEPATALSSGADGLDAIRQIVDGASAHLAPGGQLWLEHGYDQAVAVKELLAAAGLTGIEQYRDLAGIVRVSGGRRQ